MELKNCPTSADGGITRAPSVESGGRGLGAAHGHGVLIGFSDLSACADTAREIGLEWCVQVQPAELQHVEMWTQIIDTALWEETA
jgi:hypothetical protein